MRMTQLWRAAFLVVLVPAMMGADGEGCSGDEPSGDEPSGNNPPATIANPTGDCTAEGDGAHECYSVSDPSRTWMLDCNHPLDRTYWRVYALSEESAAMLPRPDGTGITFGICGGGDAALEALFSEYGLCSEALDSAGVEKINDMRLADALAISHALHERLQFTAVEGSTRWDIVPWTLPADLRDACPAAATNSGDATLQGKCDTYLEDACGPTDIGSVLDLDQPQAEALASALNDLYGIS